MTNIEIKWFIEFITQYKNEWDFFKPTSPTVSLHRVDNNHYLEHFENKLNDVVSISVIAGLCGSVWS